MKLVELFQKVKEQRLTKDELEEYRDQLSSLFADMTMEIADLEKAEAIFMGKSNDELSVAQRKINWKATDEGQRLIVLKRYCLATKEILSSLKSRLYQQY